VKSIVLRKNKARIAFHCTICGIPMTVWIDTGSPNTLVPADFVKRSGLTPIKGASFKGVIAGYAFEKRPAIMIPEIIIPNHYTIRNIRAITALDGKDFRNTVVLGMNVLNHGTTCIERDGDSGRFSFLPSLTSKIEGSERSIFNHLIINGKYLTTDAEADEPEINEMT